MNCVFNIIRRTTLVNFRKNSSSVFFKSFKPKTIERCFHKSIPLLGKMFQENENRFAYGVMESKGYAIQFDRPYKSNKTSKEQFKSLMKENWGRKHPNEMFEVFPILGLYSCENNLCITNKMFDDYIDNLTDNIKYASDEELESLFYGLLKWPDTASIRSRNFIEVWTALDDECLNRIRDWEFHDMLRFVSLFFIINVSRNSDFSFKALQKLASKANKLSAEELVQTLFYVGVYRKSPHDIHNLEVHLNNNFSSFTIDELAIMSMGFFKSKTPLRDLSLLNKLIETITENSSQIHEVSLAALLKILRYSIKIADGERLHALMSKLEPEIPRLSLMCCVHLTLLGTTTLFINEKCLDKIAEKFCKEMKTARLKDLERIVMTYGVLGYKPKTEEDFFNKVLDELRSPDRDHEVNTYGRCFACCISYFGLLGMRPLDLISKCLDPAFIEKVYGKNKFTYGRELLTLNNLIEIYDKDTPNINKLDHKTTKMLAKRYTDYVPDENFKKQYNVTEKMFLDVVKVLRNGCGGSQFVLGDHILTHHQRGDIILCKDNNGNLLPVVDLFPKEFGHIHKPPDDNKWIVLVIAGRNTIIKNRDAVTGPLKSKILELKTLGYCASLVRWDKWQNFANETEKYKYLCNLIENSVKTTE